MTPTDGKTEEAITDAIKRHITLAYSLYQHLLPPEKEEVDKFLEEMNTDGKS